MKTYGKLFYCRFLYLFLLILPHFFYAQARLVLNNNGYINIENSAYLVVDNNNANAITTLGTGGNLYHGALTLNGYK